ncbi:Choline/ethanolamine kinase [Dictyocaulus viviparus]|uniref:Choline/ethanolamine kinase n=1 Tax=Dictyocaulus viviparus TaxID=29172 RepID=A0A0D8Y1E7_DICVI|nr:Choline/ethanolamine kinase [Dictyocaulus viviparus]
MFCITLENWTYFKSHDEFNLRNRIHSLCCDLLGGKWIDLHPNDISITNRGGLTNLVYLVSRPRSTTFDDQPCSVVLRIQSQIDHEKLLTELVVFTSLAENGLGPKLLGVFPGGRLEEYISSRQVQHHEVTHPIIRSLLARVLPRFHASVVPISKRPNLLSLMREWLALYEEQGNSHVQMHSTSFRLHPIPFPPIVSVNDLVREIDIIEKFLDRASSPVVFCHNDLTSGNLLISLTSKSTSPSCTSEEISLNGGNKQSLSLNLVDFEFSAYNYRGFDLANYFCAAAIEHNVNEFPHYKIDMNKLQNRQIKIDFCKEYVREAQKLNIHIKSEFSLLREINEFTPIVHLFWAIFNLYCEKDTLAVMDCGAYARDRLALYYLTRNILSDREMKQS